jgi:hypothetical protein
VWPWDQQEPFGNNPADENPSGVGAFDLPLRLVVVEGARVLIGCCSIHGRHAASCAWDASVLRSMSKTRPPHLPRINTPRETY